MRRALLIGSFGLGIAGCSLLSGSPPSGVVPPEFMTLSISNGTTLDVWLVVNDQPIEVVAAHTSKDAVPARALPALPWRVEARSPTGRVLVSMTVRAGDVWSATSPEGGTAKGDGARVDLSCGRLDIWSGPPLLGPAPGPGSLGDCAP